MAATHVRNLAFWEKKKWTPNSVVVITGAGSGIGRAVALKYAKRKCRLVLADIAAQSLPSVVDDCQRSGSQAIAVPTDCTKNSECEALIKTAVSKFGGIDVLVLCAGIGAHHIFEETPADLNVFKKLMDVNFYGYLYPTFHAFHYLCKSKGVLVAITSFSGEVGLPYRTAYCASKFAATGFLEALRAEMRERNLNGGSTNQFDITVICPPSIDTNLRKNSLTTDERFKNAEGKHSLTVEDCSQVILDSADRRLRKAFFPFKSWVGAYTRPLIPDLVDKKIWKRSAL